MRHSGRARRRAAAAGSSERFNIDMQVQSSAKVHYSKYAKLGLAPRLRSEPRQRFPMNDAKLGWNLGHSWRKTQPQRSFHRLQPLACGGVPRNVLCPKVKLEHSETRPQRSFHRLQPPACGRVPETVLCPALGRPLVFPLEAKRTQGARDIFPSGPQ